MGPVIIIIMEVVAYLITAGTFIRIASYYVYFLLLGCTKEPLGKGIVCWSSYPCK